MYVVLIEVVVVGDWVILFVEYNFDVVMGFVMCMIVFDCEGCVVFDGFVVEVFCDYVDELVVMGVWLFGVIFVVFWLCV